MYTAALKHCFDKYNFVAEFYSKSKTEELIGVECDDSYSDCLKAFARELRLTQFLFGGNVFYATDERIIADYVNVPIIEKRTPLPTPQELIAELKLFCINPYSDVVTEVTGVTYDALSKWGVDKSFDENTIKNLVMILNKKYGVLKPLSMYY